MNDDLNNMTLSSYGGVKFTTNLGSTRTSWTHGFGKFTHRTAPKKSASPFLMKTGGNNSLLKRRPHFQNKTQRSIRMLKSTGVSPMRFTKKGYANMSQSHNFELGRNKLNRGSGKYPSVVGSSHSFPRHNRLLRTTHMSMGLGRSHSKPSNNHSKNIFKINTGLARNKSMPLFAKSQYHGLKINYSLGFN